MATQTLNSWRFGAFRMDLVRRVLLKDGEPVAVTPKSFDVLALLVARRSEVVSKEEIMAEVWAGTAVEESNLTFHISTLRRAMGDSGRHREYIVTVPGRGYRFVAPVAEGEAIEPQPMIQETPTPSPAETFDQPRRMFSWKWTVGLLVCAGLAAGLYFYYARASEPWQELTFDRAEDTQPDVSPDGQVVFVSNRQGHQDIWVMASNGSRQRNLTPNTGENDSPAWSPDGHSIAFQRSTSGGAPFIFVMNTDGSGQRRVSPLTGARVSWSPDGKTLAYEAARENRIPGIFRLNLASGSETRLTDPDVYAFDPAWSPDGRSIAHTRRTPRGLQIFTMDADGGQAQQLTWFYGMAAHVPAWSHDGSRIAFTGSRDREEEIYLMRADGTEVSRLTQGVPDAGEAAWSHDDRRIFF